MDGSTTGTDKHGRRSRRALALTAGALAWATLLGAPDARADTLSDLRAAAAAAQSNQRMASAEVEQSRGHVNSATAELIRSQEELARAQAILADLRVQLEAARERDRQLAAELAAAQAALAAARERVAQGEADVAEQQRVIVGAVTESFQQKTDLAGLAVVFEAGTTAELGQRLQWNTTIFDTQAAQKSRLDAILLELQAARDEAAALEEKVAAAKAESEENVRRVAGLEASATAQEAAVAGLVAANDRARANAEAALAADEAEYRAFAEEEVRLQGEIQGELARLKAEAEARERAAREEAARVEAARQAAARAEEARRAAARAAAAREEAARQSATRPVARPQPPARVTDPAPSRPAGPRVSAYGFIRPVNVSPGSPFGLRFHPILNYWRMHNGNDWGAPTGTPIYAIQSGTVLKAGPNGGFGNFVLLGHGNVKGSYVTSGYAHQSRIVVAVGQRVERGQVIGYVGDTGLSTTPHLHFELRLDGVPVNPMAYLP